MSYNNLVHNLRLKHCYSWLKFEIDVVRNSTCAFVNTFSSVVNSDSPSQLPNYDDFYRNRWRAPTSFTDVLFKIKIGIDLISLVALSIPGTCNRTSVPSPHISADTGVTLTKQRYRWHCKRKERTDHLSTGTSSENRSPPVY